MFNYMCDPDFLRDAIMGEQGVTWEYAADGVPRLTDYGREQLAEYNAGQRTGGQLLLPLGKLTETSPAAGRSCGTIRSIRTGILLILPRSPGNTMQPP